MEQNEHSEWFETKTGVREGIVLPPELFNVVMDETVVKVRGHVRDICDDIC
jgi:hypothetical protein